MNVGDSFSESKYLLKVIILSVAYNVDIPVNMGPFTDINLPTFDAFFF